jgi:hypothetical protein
MSHADQKACCFLACRHHFHLQCIMQWAQRSRECPLCFKSLQLEVRLCSPAMKLSRPCILEVQLVVCFLGWSLSAC